jgi:ubiquinone/menaquinone biosynthesis C-methylase UbiE
MNTSLRHDTPRLAETYDKVSDSQFEGGKRLVEGLAIARGERVLDVGCGTGRLAEYLAERVTEDGHVAGIDPLPDRIAIARDRAPAVRFEVGQAKDLSAFADSSFDVVVMSAVLHWVADKPKALTEVKRVLRPRGRLGLTTLPRELLGQMTITQVIGATLAAASYSHEVDLSALAVASQGLTTTELITLVVAAGLEPLAVHVGPRRHVHASGDDAIDFFEASTFGNFLRIVPEVRRPQMRADLAAAFDARRGPEGLVLTDWGTALVARSV